LTVFNTIDTREFVSYGELWADGGGLSFLSSNSNLSDLAWSWSVATIGMLSI